jgi:hypothetical protein
MRPWPRIESHVEAALTPKTRCQATYASRRLAGDHRGVPQCWVTSGPGSRANDAAQPRCRADRFGHLVDVYRFSSRRAVGGRVSQLQLTPLPTDLQESLRVPEYSEGGS